MQTFLLFCKFTKRGLTMVKDTPTILNPTSETLASYGAAVRTYYMTEGRYDLVLVLEADSDDAIEQVSLFLRSQGHIARSHWSRAYGEKQFLQMAQDALK